MTYRHYDHDGRIRFVTFATRQLTPVLSNSCYRDIVVECLEEVCAEYKVRIIAYVVMPEHVHLMLLPPIEICLAPVIGDIKRLSAKRIHLRMSPDSELAKRLTTVRCGQARFSLWQKRCYDHNCRTVQSVRRTIDYCHMNPVRRGLVKRPEDWRWSSYRGYCDGVGERAFTIIGQPSKAPVG